MINKNKSIIYLILLVVISFIVGCATTKKSHVERASELLLKGKQKLAIEEYKNAIDEDETNIRAHFDLAHIYFDRKEWEKAIPLLEKTAKLQPKYKTTNTLIAMAYVNTNRIKDKGLSVFPSEIDTTDPELLYAIGIDFHNKGFFKRSLDYLERASIDEKYLESYIYISQIYCSEQRYKEAINILRKYLDKKYNLYQHLRLAMIYKEIDNGNIAEDEFNKVIAKTDTFYKEKTKTFYHSWLGMLHFLWGNYPEAIEEWKISKLNYNNYTSTHHNLCTAYLAKGYCYELIIEYEKAKKQFPEEPILHIDEGFRELGLKNYENALVKFKLALEKTPLSGVCNGYMAYTLDKLGRNEEAQKYWNLCILKVPDGVNLQNVHRFIEKMVNNAIECTKTK